MDITWIKPALVGAGAGAVALAIAGFSWGGWVTGGTASEMANRASKDAREQLVASICVDAFVLNPDAAKNLVELKGAKSYERDDLIEAGGWIVVPGVDELITGAADVCAERLVAMDALPERVVMPDAVDVEPMNVDAEPVATDG